MNNFKVKRTKRHFIAIISVTSVRNVSYTPPSEWEELHKVSFLRLAFTNYLNFPRVRVLFLCTNWCLMNDAIGSWNVFYEMKWLWRIIVSVFNIVEIFTYQRYWSYLISLAWKPYTCAMEWCKKGCNFTDCRISIGTNFIFQLTYYNIDRETPYSQVYSCLISESRINDSYMRSTSVG